MYTNIRFVNRSLNPHLPDIGAYFGCDSSDHNVQSRLWYLIRRCGFLWWHPVRIYWDHICEFHARSGNRIARCKLQTLIKYPEIQNLLGIVARLDLVEGQEVLKIERTGKSKVMCVTLLINGRPIAEGSLSRNGSVTSLPVAHQLSFCADMYLNQEDVVRRKNTNISQCTFDLTGLRSVTISMKGGQPGPNSEPIKFVATHIKRW